MFKTFKTLTAAFLVLGLASAPEVNAGPLAYGICQTGCNALAVACYTSAGATFGTVTAGVGTPFAIIDCNVALGACMTSCVAAGCTPTTNREEAKQLEAAIWAACQAGSGSHLFTVEKGTSRSRGWEPSCRIRK